MKNLTDTQTAAIRTTVNAAVMAIVAWVAANLLNTDLRLDDPIVIAIISVLTGVVYTASLWAVNKWPVLGTVLFGINKPPSYTPPEPAE